MLCDNNAVIGGLHMVHEREDQKVCGPVMPQGKDKSITGLEWVCCKKRQKIVPDKLLVWEIRAL